MRKLTPELLDHLPHDDPGALRSRNDLLRINRFMGNEAWIMRNLHPETSSISELGAGDGALLSKIHNKYPDLAIHGYDLAPKPSGLLESIQWHQGDFLESPLAQTGGTLIANLILHHFTDAQLIALGEKFKEFDRIIINEPLRAKIPAFLAKLATPFVHPITRHDMRVSIEAGFIRDEIPSLLALEKHGFHFQETYTWRGSQRVLAWSV
ncbi:MAG: class I SAM-dependent methyltransferase [Verrucomicrobiota bacterium]